MIEAIFILRPRHQIALLNKPPHPFLSFHVFTRVAWIHVDLGVYPVITDKSSCFSGETGGLSLTWMVERGTLCSWFHPTSEPFKPCVESSSGLLHHPPGTPVEPGFTPSLAACWKFLQCGVSRLGAVEIVLFFLSALVPIEKQVRRILNWRLLFMLISFFIHTHTIKLALTFVYVRFL